MAEGCLEACVCYQEARAVSVCLELPHYMTCFDTTTPCLSTATFEIVKSIAGHE